MVILVLFVAAVDLLDGLRAGGLDPQPLRAIAAPDQRRSGHRRSRRAGYQSVAPFLLIVFAPVFAWHLVALGRQTRRVPPSSPSLWFRLGLGFAILVIRCRRRRRSGVRGEPDVAGGHLSPADLGELCLSPVGLSAMTQAGTGAHRRTDDGRVVPGPVGGKLPGGRAASLYETFLLTAPRSARVRAVLPRLRPWCWRY